MERQAAICARLPDSLLLERMRKSVLVEGSKQSLQTYLDSLKRAQVNAAQVAGLKPEQLSLCEMLLRPEETLERLNSKVLDGTWRPSTLATTVTAMMALLKHGELREDERAGPRFARAGVKWRDLGQQMVAGAKEKATADDKKSSAEDRDNKVTWVQVSKVSERLEAEADQLRARGQDHAAADMEALLSSFYCDMPPRRQSDYFRIFIVREDVPAQRAAADREPAYLDMTREMMRAGDGHPLLVIKEFKTAKKYGPWLARLPPRTYGLLRRSLESRPRDFVFTRATGAPFEDANAFTKRHNILLRRWFGPGVTLRHLRHASASRLHSDPRITPEEREQYAIAMGHSLKVSGTVYATASKPTMRRDGSYDVISAGTDGRPVVYECRPKSAAPKSKPNLTLNIKPATVGKQIRHMTKNNKGVA
jgi:integrase